MLRSIKDYIKAFLRARGYFLVYVPPCSLSGFDLECDLRRSIGSESPTVLDVGANEGQTIEMLQRIFPSPRILSFEPSPQAWSKLCRFETKGGVKLFNLALSAQPGTVVLHQYESTVLNSSLELDDNGENPFRQVSKLSSVTVQTTTIDQVLGEEDITHVDLLKIDTQGTDLAVLQGAQHSLEKGVITHVLVELNFSHLYKSQASAAEIHKFLETKGFRLIDYYEKNRHGDSLAWCTALFSRQP